jgi:hypothetical protein
MGSFAREEAPTHLSTLLAVYVSPTIVFVSESPCGVDSNATGLTNQHSGQAEHADATAWPILSSSSLPILSISFDPNEAKRLDGWT